MLSKRRALRVASSTAVLGAIAGCLGVFRDGSVLVRIENRDDRRHAVVIRLDRGDEPAFADRYTIEPGATRTASDVVAAGEYLVTLELDAGATETVEFDMAGCRSNTLFASISAAGGLEAGVLDAC